MKKLIRDTNTGDYTSQDGQYLIEKGTTGWNVSELNSTRSEQYGISVYDYSFSCSTLKEVRESI